MRAENAAALTNFVVVLLIAAGLVSLSWLSNRADAVAYADPARHVVKTAAWVILLLMLATPFAAIASWRTWVHAQRFLARQGTGWRGVFEAGAMGFVLTLPFVLPGIVARQFHPGQWGQPQALLLGLAYVGVYGFLGLAVGLVLGCVLRLSAIIALLVHRRSAS